MNTFTVIPANRPRLGQLRRCLASIRQPAEKVVVVSNGPPEDRIYRGGETGRDAWVLQDTHEDINISRWWAQGMSWAIQEGATEVLLLNTDAVVDRRGIQTLARSIYELDVSICGPDYRGIAFRHAPGDGKDGQRAMINRSRGQVPWTHRVPGFCMMVRIEERPETYEDPDIQVWPNEEMRWWYSDDDIEWQAREARGTALIPDVEVRHPAAGGTLLDETLGRWAQEDLAKFVAKWGCEPCLPV